MAILTPFFEVSPLQYYIAHIEVMLVCHGPKHITDLRQAKVRMDICSYQIVLRTIMRAFFTASQSAMSRTLAWFTSILRTNAPTGGLVDSVCFFNNICIVLEDLFDQFIRRDILQVGFIDAGYFHQQSPLNPEPAPSPGLHEPRIVLSKHTRNESETITDVIVLILEAYDHEQSETRAAIENCSREISVTSSKNTLRKATKTWLSLKKMTKSLLYQEVTRTSSLYFVKFVVKWFLQPTEKNRPFQSPLAYAMPDPSTIRSESALGIVMGRFALSNVIPPQVENEMYALYITLLTTPDYALRLKSSSATALYRKTQGTQGSFVSFLNDNRSEATALLKGLIEFYIARSSNSHGDLEGSLSNSLQVIKYVGTVCKGELEALSRGHRLKFSRFIDLFIGDVGAVFRRRLAILSGTGRELGIREVDLSSLADDCMGVLVFFTTALQKAFTRPEVVEKLAGMLAENLASLEGPRSAHLIRGFVRIYLQLKSHPVFIDAIVNDQWWYNSGLVPRVTDIVMSSESEKRKRSWQDLVEKVEIAKDKWDYLSKYMPPEFVDIIGGGLMQCPVRLPSGQIVDCWKIVRHLLNNSWDPFTRLPLAISSIVPITDLRLQIKKWKDDRKREYALGRRAPSLGPEENQ